MAKGKIYAQISATWNDVKRNPILLVYALALDLLFFFLYGFIASTIFDKILEYLTYMSTEFSKNAPSAIRDYTASPTIFEIIGGSPEMSSAFKSIIIMIVLLVVSVYILYSIFQGLSWKLSSQIAGEKISFYRYCRIFAIVNILWFALFFIYQIIGFVNDFNQMAAESMGTQYGNLGTLLFIVFLVGVYFMSISYALVVRMPAWKSLKGCFVVGIKKLPYILPRALLIFAALFIFDKILLALSGDRTVLLIVGIFVFFPFVTVLRTYVFKFMEVVEV